MSLDTVLIVDIGNSRTKVSIARGADPLVPESLCTSHCSVSRVEAMIQKFDIRSAIISSTKASVDSELLDMLNARLDKVICLSHTTPTPLVNRYSTPATLGMDRLAACVGAAFMAPNQDLMVVDMGTAMTIDFVTARGEFLGGVISPGMSMRFKALHTMTQSLPFCYKADSEPFSGPEDRLYGSSTAEAIGRGVIQGMVMEIEGYAKKSGCETIFFTGGDSFYFAERVKCAIFANYELVIIGLNQIFRYNAESKTE